MVKKFLEIGSDVNILEMEMSKQENQVTVTLRQLLKLHFRIL